MSQHKIWQRQNYKIIFQQEKENVGLCSRLAFFFFRLESYKRFLTFGIFIGNKGWPKMLHIFLCAGHGNDTFSILHLETDAKCGHSGR